MYEELIAAAAIVLTFVTLVPLRTVLFPAAVGIARVLFVAMVGYRRAQLRVRRERTDRASEPGS